MICLAQGLIIMIYVFVTDRLIRFCLYSKEVVFYKTIDPLTYWQGRRQGWAWQGPGPPKCWLCPANEIEDGML